jgi:hypothetical protein
VELKYCSLKEAEASRSGSCGLQQTAWNRYSFPSYDSSWFPSLQMKRARSYTFGTVSISLCIKDVIARREPIRNFNNFTLKLHKLRPDYLLMQTIYAFNIILHYLLTADHNGRAVWGMNSLRSLEHWDRGFESRSRHGCLCVFIVLCVGRSLETGLSPVQGVLLTVYRIKKLWKRPRPNKGL